MVTCEIQERVVLFVLHCGGWLDPPGYDINNQCRKRDEYWDGVVRSRGVASRCSSMQRLLIDLEDHEAIIIL